MGSYTAGRRLRVGASDLNLGDAVDDAAVASWPDFIVAEYLRTGDLQQSGAAVSTSNEEQASALIAATPAGVSGPGLSDHFLGTVLRDTWTNDGNHTPIEAPSVQYSTFSFIGASNNPVDYHKGFTPSGDFEVQARVLSLEPACDIGFWVWDDDANPDTVYNDGGFGVRGFNSGLGTTYQANSQNSGDGYANPRGASSGSLHGWVYLSIARVGDNWTAKVSQDRYQWRPLVSAFAQSFTVGKIGFRTSPTSPVSPVVCDFIDVVT